MDLVHKDEQVVDNGCWIILAPFVGTHSMHSLKPLSAALSVVAATPN